MLSCQRPLTHLDSLACSLANNQLCGLYYEYEQGYDAQLKGTYTAEGITKLCEVLKGSAVTSLKCAATPKRLLLCQRPLTRLMSHCPLLAV